MNLPFLRDVMAPSDAELPIRTFRRGGSMKFAGLEILFGYLPAAHSDSDIWLYFPMLDTPTAGAPLTAGQWTILDGRAVKSL